MSSRNITPLSRPFARGNKGIFAVLTALAGLMALGAAGCEATFRPGPLTASWEVGGAWVAEPPDDITRYPHVWYEGRWVYLVDGFWYAPTARGWIVLREEPRELGRYREYYESGPQRRRERTPPQERDRYRTY